MNKAQQMGRITQTAPAQINEKMRGDAAAPPAFRQMPETTMETSRGLLGL